MYAADDKLLHNVEVTLVICIRKTTVQLLYHHTMDMCLCTIVNVSTTNCVLYLMRWQTWSGANVSVKTSRWSVTMTKELLWDCSKLENNPRTPVTIRKIVLHSSRVCKQPRGLKQYHKSNDFIYSFNAKISSSFHSHPWGLWGRLTVSWNVLANDIPRDDDPRP